MAEPTAPAAPRRQNRPSKTRLMKTLLAAFAAEAARPVIGGQAVIEGVMMRSPHSFAVAVRRPDGSIVVREEAWLSFSERFRFLKWPLLRGANMLVESMYNGLGALNFSAEQAMLEEPEGEAGEGATSADKPKVRASSALLGAGSLTATGGAGAPSPSEAGAPSKAALWMTLAGSLLVAIALFKGLPHFAAWGIGHLIGGEHPLTVEDPLFHLIDGGIKMIVFVGYILAISTMDDVKRLFMYHGAEHMSVHTWEAGAPLELETTRPQSTAHPRCGTTLLLLVITTSILVFVAVIPFLPRVSDSDLVQTIFAFLVKIPLMLPIAGIAYEFQRAAAKRPDNLLVRAFIAPGMLMQRLTTRQPNDPELEVALAALRKAVWREQVTREGGEKVRGQAEVEVFRDFAEVKELVAAA